MGREFGILTGCCVAIIGALLVVGWVSHGVIRHIVQTSPLWIPILFSLNRSGLSKWAALPCFVFWLLIMTAIWLYLLGWAHLLSGTFSPTEIAMTLVVGFASAVGILRAAGIRSGVRAGAAVLTALLVAVFQLVAFRLSFLPQIVHR